MALRLLHTSDLHLGRALHGESLLADQEWLLDRLVELARDVRPDALLVAGDVYDRAVPPPEAVALLDDFVTRIASLRVPLIAIAGNHDSPERLGFGARLLETRGVHFRGGLRRTAEPVELGDKGLVYALPFVDPEVVRGLEGDEDIRGHAAATEHALRAARVDASRRSLPKVLVAHAFVQGATETPDSERPLSVGGTGCIPAATLTGFDHVALGHLHAPQDVASGVHYSGSPLKYSFSEAGHVKAVALTEVSVGRSRTEAVPLGARRDVVRLRGTLAELLERGELARHANDLVEATLDDDGYVFDAKRRLEARFAHVLNVVRKDLVPGGAGRFARHVEGAGRDDARLFDAFFRTVAGEAPSDEQRAAFAAALSAVDRDERRA